MKAGQLKDIIYIEFPTTQQSQYGEKITVWNVKCQTRAGVKYVSNNRTTEQNEILFSNTVEFTIRYYISINETDRIQYKGKLYRILSILPDSNTQKQTIITELIND